MKVKRLIPAVAMLLVSAMLLGTSTFAWFSMNDSVTATNMKISVNSNTTYLLISNANTTAASAPANAAAIQAENSGNGYTTVNINTSPAKEVYPVAPAATFTAAEYYTAADELADPTHVEGTLKTPASHTEYAAGASVSDPTIWYSMIGTNPTSTGYVGVAGSESNVTASKDDYVLEYTLYFTIAAGANSATDLVIDSVTITGDSAVRCLVVGTNGSALYTASTDTDSIVLESSLNSTTVYSVNVYVYYDGNASSIYTNNIPSITDGSVDLTFKVTAA